MSFKRKGFTVTELLVASALFILVGTLIVVAMSHVLQKFSNTVGDTKQRSAEAISLDDLIFDIKHAGYGISVDEDALVMNYCNGFSCLSNDACFIATHYIAPAGNKLLLLRETTNIADPDYSYTDPDFGFGFVMWNGTGVVYNATNGYRVCGTSSTYLREECAWMDGQGHYLGNSTCCQVAGGYSSIAFGFPKDTDSACEQPFGGWTFIFQRACCKDQYCTGILWYLKQPAAAVDYCLSGTYTLYRQTTSPSSSSGFQTPVPVLNCVADWDVVFGLDTDGDGNVDYWVDRLPYTCGMTNDDIKQEVKLVKVYMLVQSSYIPDKTYDFCSIRNVDCDDPNTCGNGYVLVDTLRDGSGNPVYVCLKHPSDANWRHYRWHVVDLTISYLPNIP